MNIPTKEELEKERMGFGLDEELPDFRFGGEAEGIIEFARTMSQFQISKADENFIGYLIWGEYPYTLDNLVFQWEEFVMRDGIRLVRMDGNNPIYEDKYTEKEKEQKALAWFDRRIGKLIRLGALDCSISTKYFDSLKKNLQYADFIGRIKQRLLTKGSE